MKREIRLLQLIKSHRVLTRLVIIFNILVLNGCSKNGTSSDLEDYLKTFDQVLTDQYIWGYGSGGIYWVSNDQVVLEAHIMDKKGVLDRGLYQVDVVDGSYKKVVDVPDEGPITYKYCFDGTKLHVMTSRGIFTQTNSPSGYQVEIREMGKLKDHNRYSPLRCRFTSLPQGKKVAYIPLREKDGFVKNQGGETKSEPVRVFLTDETGINIQELGGKRLDARGLIGIRKYVPHKNAYFGNTSFNNNCTYLSWLYRDGWMLEQKKLCLSDWSVGSRVISNLKDALYVEHHTDTANEPKSYVIYPDKTLPIETVQIRSSTVSPDGCKVAYGIGKYQSGSKGPRQKLKVFNYCEYQKKENES